MAKTTNATSDTVLQTATETPATGEPAASSEATKATETPQSEVEAEYIPVKYRSPIKRVVYGMGNGEHLVFENGQFTAKTEEQSNFLKNHPDYGRSLFLMKGE